jgi:hypothetical protein
MLTYISIDELKIPRAIASSFLFSSCKTSLDHELPNYNIKVYKLKSIAEKTQIA